MPEIRVRTRIVGGGATIEEQVVRAAERGVTPLAVDVPPATAATLAVRTGDDAGTLALAGGHAVTTGATLDLYWPGGRRYGVTVGTVAGNDAPFSGGSGDALPAALAAISAAVPVPFFALVEGPALVLLAVRMKFLARDAAARGRVLLRAANGDPAASIDLLANTPRAYHVVAGDPNPLGTATATHGTASHGDTARGATLEMVGLMRSAVAATGPEGDGLLLEEGGYLLTEDEEFLVLD